MDCNTRCGFEVSKSPGLPYAGVRSDLLLLSVNVGFQLVPRMSSEIRPLLSMFG